MLTVLPLTSIWSLPGLLAAFLQGLAQQFTKLIQKKYRKNQLFRVTYKLNRYLVLLLTNFMSNYLNYFKHVQFQEGENSFLWQDAYLHTAMCFK